MESNFSGLENSALTNITHAIVTMQIAESNGIQEDYGPQVCVQCIEDTHQHVHGEGIKVCRRKRAFSDKRGQKDHICSRRLGCLQDTS